MDFPIRINKYLAHGGYATRRSADRLIEDGKVFVNGKAAELGQKVNEEDVVEIKDHDTSNFRYILYHKPRDIVTLASGPEELDITKKIKADHSIEGLFPIGRLDKETEGLIVLTNDGRLTSRLLEVSKDQEYEVTVDKQVTKSLISRINRGVKIESHITKTTKAKTMGESGYKFTISLGENKKNNVRSICAALGLHIVSLKRTRMLNFELKRLKPGEFYELKENEIKGLHKALNLR